MTLLSGIKCRYCYLHRYYPDIELCVSEMRGEQKAKEREQQKEREEDYGDSAVGEQVRNIH